MKIVADENMPALEDTFAPGNQLVRVNGRHIKSDDVEDADVLLVRSITRVDADLLNNSNVRFVGTATIGLDHLDTNWLDDRGILWANAPGCNADAAAQFTLAMMMLACERLNKDFLQQSVGVIGYGNVGSRLVFLLQSLGMTVSACDPHLQDAGQPGLVSMSEACSQNIVSVHVPLTDTGPYPTRHLINKTMLAQLSAGSLLVNAARGGIVDAEALLAELDSGRLHAALDVWPNEPLIEHQLLDAAIVATPHVAGSSVQGKRNGTLMIYQSFCQAFPEPATTPGAVVQPMPIVGTHKLPADIAFAEALSLLVESSCPVARDDKTLRALMATASPVSGPSPGTGLANQPSVQIDTLRSHYPRRFEFSSWAFKSTAKSTREVLNRLGFLST